MIQIIMKMKIAKNFIKVNFKFIFFITIIMKIYISKYLLFLDNSLEK